MQDQARFLPLHQYLCSLKLLSQLVRISCVSRLQQTTCSKGMHVSLFFPTHLYSRSFSVPSRCKQSSGKSTGGRVRCSTVRHSAQTAAAKRSVTACPQYAANSKAFISSQCILQHHPVSNITSMRKGRKASLTPFASQEPRHVSPDQVQYLCLCC